jgi:hypothetical protein
LSRQLGRRSRRRRRRRRRRRWRRRVGRRRSKQGGGDGEDQEGEWERQRRLRREEAALESLIDSELQIEKVIKWASEEEFELRRRFCKYAAMTIACCEKDREMRVSANCCRGDTWWNAAYWQSLGEFESCCESGTGKPHWKLLCVGCQEVVCRCTCTVECACGQQIAKWGWVKDAQICYCKPYPVRSSFPGRGTTTRARRDGAEWHNLLPWWPHLREDEEEEEGAGDY